MNRKQRIAKAYDHKRLLSSKSNEYKRIVNGYFKEAIAQDLGDRGDLTTDYVLGKYNPNLKAKIVAKQRGIIAGIEEVSLFHKKIGIDFKPKKKDGEIVKIGEIIATLEGKEKLILRKERVALNLLQRMSGIATISNSLSKKLENKNIRIAATRKNPLGNLDNKAAAVGGALTHRLGLWHAILVKENHLEALKQSGCKDYIETAIVKALKHKTSAFYGIETRTIAEALRAAVEFAKHDLSSKVAVIMLDNFSPKEIKETIALLKKKGFYKDILIEVSGGISPVNISKYAINGVDVISTGWITHSASQLDMSQIVIRK